MTAHQPMSPAMETDADLDTFPAYIPIDPRSPDPDFRPGAVWTQARADYLAGESAPRVCQRYELALSTFRTRMRVEGWRRCDQKDEEVEPRELDPAPPTQELVEQAWRAMADALRRGRAYEARTFLRLVHDLRAEVSREEAIVQHQAYKAAYAATHYPALHGLHSGSNSAALTDPSSAHPREGGDPVDLSTAVTHEPPPEQMNPLDPRLRGDERECGAPNRDFSLTLPGGVPDVPLAGAAGDGPPEHVRGRREGGGAEPDMDTSDPALHCLHARSHSVADGFVTEPPSSSAPAPAWGSAGPPGGG
jgi:hypothetical protein